MCHKSARTLNFEILIIIYVILDFLVWYLYSDLGVLQTHPLFIAQAVEAYLCCVKPIDDDIEWTMEVFLC